MEDTKTVVKENRKATNEDIQECNLEENCDPIVIRPDQSLNTDSDSDNEFELSDALETNCKSGIVDELTDIKQKRISDKNKDIEEESGPETWKDDDADSYRDAEDHEQSGNELNDIDLKDLKEEELKRRQESEDRLSDEIKQERRQDARNMKESGNKLINKNENNEAITIYTEALNVCPLCFKEDRSILFANRAVAKLKLENKEGAIEDCSEAIELNPNYLKASLRRAHLFEDTDKPHESMKDFEKVLELDPKHAEANVAVRVRLPEKIKEKDERIKAEMMDNLKKLGNMCLNPFGLSTDNFQFVQDPNTGGYSVNFKK